MRSVLLLTAAALSLSACAVVPIQPAPAPVSPVVVAPIPAPVVTNPRPTVSTNSSANRAAAVSIVNREMASRLPGRNVMPYTSCIINNATEAEIADLAATAKSGTSAAGAVAAIVKRPAATSCIASLSRVS